MCEGDLKFQWFTAQNRKKHQTKLNQIRAMNIRSEIAKLFSELAGFKVDLARGNKKRLNRIHDFQARIRLLQAELGTLHSPCLAA